MEHLVEKHRVSSQPGANNYHGRPQGQWCTTLTRCALIQCVADSFNIVNTGNFAITLDESINYPKWVEEYNSLNHKLRRSVYRRGNKALNLRKKSFYPSLFNYLESKYNHKQLKKAVDDESSHQKIFVEVNATNLLDDSIDIFDEEFSFLDDSFILDDPVSIEHEEFDMFADSDFEEIKESSSSESEDEEEKVFETQSKKPIVTSKGTELVGKSKEEFLKSKSKKKKARKRGIRTSKRAKKEERKAQRYTKAHYYEDIDIPTFSAIEKRLQTGKQKTKSNHKIKTRKVNLELATEEDKRKLAYNPTGRTYKKLLRKEDELKVSYNSKQSKVKPRKHYGPHNGKGRSTAQSRRRNRRKTKFVTESSEDFFGDLSFESENSGFKQLKTVIMHAFPDINIKRMERCALAVYSTGYDLLRSQSVHDVVLSFAPLYLELCPGGAPFSDLMDTLYNLGKKLWNLIPYLDLSPDFSPEEAFYFEDSLRDKCSSIYVTILNSDFVNTILDIMKTLVAGICPVVISAHVFKYVSRPKGYTFSDLLNTVITSIFKLWEYMERLYYGESFSDVFIDGDSVANFMRACEILIQDRERVARGLVDENFVNETNYLQRAESLIADFDKLVLSKMDPRYRTVVRLRDSVVLSYNSVKMNKFHANRCAPFAIVLCGQPGVGKSTVLKHLVRAWSKVAGIDYTESMVYPRNRTSDYWEGYNPVTQPVVHYSEIAGRSKKIAATGQGDLSELLSVCDNLHMNADMAAMLSKGNVAIAPELVIGDTNNERLHAEVYAFSRAAVLRRFHFVKISVKPEYTVNGSCQLDYTKVEPDMLDIYDIKFYKNYAVDNQKTAMDILYEGSSYEDFISCYMEQVAKHISHQSHVTSENFQTNMNNFLEKCYFNISEEKYPIDDLKSEASDEKHVRFDLPEEEYDLVDEKYQIQDHVEIDVEDDEPPITQRICDGVLEFILLMVSLGEYLVMSHLCKGIDDFIYAMIAAIGITFLYGIGVPSLVYFYWVLAVSALHRNGFIKRLVMRWASDRVRHIRCRAYEKFKYRLAMFRGDEYSVNWFMKKGVKIAMFGAFIAALIKVSSKLFRYRYEAESAMINSVEEKSGCEPAPRRFKPKVSASWTSVAPNDMKPKHNSSKQSLYGSVVSKNVRIAHITNSSTGGTFRTRILGVHSGFAIINTHAANRSPDLNMALYNTAGDYIRDVNIDSNCKYEIGNDISLVYHPTFAFRDISKHFATDIVAFTSGHIFSEDVTVSHITNVSVKNSDGEIVVCEAYQYMTDSHEGGLCGTPLIGNVNSTGCMIIGIHTAGSPKHVCISSAIRRTEIMEAIDAFKSSSPLFIAKQILVAEDLELPHRKSPFSYESYNNINYYGYDGAYVSFNKSKVTKSKIYDDITDYMYEEFKFYPTEMYGPPMMRPRTIKGEYVSPMNVNLRKMNTSSPTLDTILLSRCVSEYTQHILDNLTIEAMSPIPIAQAINGSDDDAYLRRINMSTSPGYGYQGTKSDYFPLLEDDVTRIMGPEIENRISELLDFYADDAIPISVFKAQLKDETREVKKCNTGSTRLFYMSPVDLLVISRMYLSPLYTAMCQDQEGFCASVGINMFTGADSFVKGLTDFSDLIFEGDYSGYDVSNPVHIAQAANTVILNVLKAKGYNDYSLNIVESILTVHMYPFVSLNGDIFMKPGMQPSGKYGTAEDNSLRGVLMMMYVYYKVGGVNAPSFFDVVKPRVYGDDLLAAVKPSVAEVFNGISYQTGCKQYLGMKFTSAAKSNDVDAFMNVHTMTFLKRKFIYDSKYGRWMAPLDLNSIYKSLYWVLPSRHATPEKQLCDNIKSMLYEIFIHDTRDHVFNRRRSNLIDLFGKHFAVSDSVFPTITDIEDSFGLLENGVDETKGSEERPKDNFFYTESGGHYASLQLNSCPINQRQNELSSSVMCSVFGIPHLPNEHANYLVNTIREEMKEISSHGILSQFELKKCDRTMSHRHRYKTDVDYRDRVKYSRRYYDLEATLQSLENTLTKITLWTESSNDMVLGNTSPPSVTTQNIQQIDGLEEKVDTHPSQTTMLNVGQDEYLDLDEFFERPVEISTFTVGTGTPVNTDLDVWDLYTKDQTVRAKLKNYAFLRGDLHLRFVISGSPFHKGRLMFSYQPFAVRNQNLSAYVTVKGIEPTTAVNELVYLSQSRYNVIMDVKANKPVDLLCPFISHKPVARLFNYSTLAIATTTSYEDVSELGRLYIRTLNDIVAPVGAADIAVQIYAYMTDVSLGCPTATQVALVTESSEEFDERKIGPIEKVSSAVASAMGELKKVPVLSVMATPAESIAKASEKAAAVMGWSYPTSINHPIRTRPYAFMNGSQVIGMSTCKDITLDPKNDLCIGGGLFGSEYDELSFEWLSSRESYLTTFSWDVSDSTFTPIWNCLVTPSLAAINGAVSAFRQPVPMAMIADWHYFWRGDIEYRFEVVASNFDRGKLAIFYEPNIPQSSLIDADLHMNKNYMYVVDIQEMQNFRLCVNWAKDRAWLRCYSPNSTTEKFDTTFVQSDVLYSNGYLTVVPFTALSNNDDSSVSVNVYVSGKDMHFNQLTESGPASRFYTESSEEMADFDYRCDVINPTSATDSGISLQHFGEEFSSFRPLIKRFVTDNVVSIGAGLAGDRTFIAQLPIWPAPSPQYGSAAPARTQILNGIMYAYMGMRGKIRNRIYTKNGSTSPATGSRTSIRLAQPSFAAPTSSLTWSTSALPVATQIGSVSFIPSTNGGIEVGLPCYTNNLFLFSCADDLIGTNPNSSVFDPTFTKEFYVEREADYTETSNFVTIDRAAGEDFGLYHFLGAPFNSV